MKPIVIEYEHSLVSDVDLTNLGDRLKPEIERVATAWGSDYNSPYAFLNLPSDKTLIRTVQEVVSEKQKLEPSMLIVIGIGGSNLGTLAVHEALQGLLYNSFNPLKIYFADTVDSDYINRIIALMEQELHDGNNVVLTIISKSGTTSETIANAQLFIQVLQKHKSREYGDYIVAITDEGSLLWQKADEYRWAKLAIPKNVGGRYSVFSAVSLFPLGMLGIDLQMLLKGAESIKQASSTKNITHNMPALSAALLFDQHRKGIMIHDTFIFAMNLKSVGAWYRQLMAESIGKAESKQGTLINEGITPTVSIGSTDLHSMVQLYLGGPSDRFTTFVSVQKMPSELKLPKESPLAGLVENIQGKSFKQIMNAILQGVQIAYKKNKRPFNALEIPELSAYYIGQLLQAKMIEMVYLAFLLDVNPFDQPQVELYKKETREILTHE
jgi:glucose-6-phosphate isomerase